MHIYVHEKKRKSNDYWAYLCCLQYIISMYITVVFSSTFLFNILLLGSLPVHFSFSEWSTVLSGSSAREGSVLDVKDHCNKTVEIYEDVSSPDLTNANRNRPLLCTYRFRSFRGAPRDWVLRIRFKKFKVGNILNATHCDGGYLQVCTTFD